MLSILSGITGLWSAPVTKYVVVATLAGSAWLYTTKLANEIESQQLVIDSKNKQLTTKQAEINMLSLSIEQANKATQAALLEIESRELIAEQRLTMLTTLRHQLTQFEQELTVLEHNNEHVKDWANEPIPTAVIGLLINTRDKHSNSGSSTETQATRTVNAAMPYTSYAFSDQPRFGQAYWQTISINNSLQF